MKRLAISLPALLAAWLCSACLTATGGSLDDNPPTVEYPPAGDNRTPSSEPVPSSRPTPSSEPTASRRPDEKTLAFGKSYTWDDGVTVTVGKPKTFTPSEFAVVEKTKDYLRFTVTVVNKSNKPVDLGMTYISVKSKNQEADHVFDSPSGLKGPPDTNVSKGKELEFHVGFGVADSKDLVMEVALHDHSGRPGLLYAT